jgi:hypothetical protein
MNKLRTANDLQDYLDAEYGWRIKEIATLKAAIRTAGLMPERTLIRAGLALLYAHWEGFIKNALTGYLNFVNTQGLSYDELPSCFVVLGMKKQINDLFASRNSAVSIAAIDFLREQLGQRAQMKIDSAINTESNLSSKVFNNLLVAVGFDPQAYETRANLIDESLLRRRNSIAHGDYLEVARADWGQLADEVIAMLRQVKNEVENAVALEKFKRKTS